jgi:hypothetical protein
MEIKKEDLVKRYNTLSDQKLIEVYKSGDLTDIALSAIKDELNKRGLTGKEIESIAHQKQQENIEAFKQAEIPKAPKVWIGFIFAATFFVGEIVLVFGFEGKFTPILTPIGFIGIFYWLFCVQRFHQILDTLTIDEYAISPGKAVGFHFIPFYNFYWVFKWPIELSKFINGLGNVTMANGGFIGLLLFICFLLYRLDGAISLTCIFLVGSYINLKIKKQISYRKGNFV